ncbi:MAG: DNA topoisomerase I [Candidatus Aenigmarchaeota archaeon]|nr:DNA topoisomerase I [Candidatus Aenigmarchaeota archaeon]
MYTLIIAEKPSAAQKIAESLADKKPIKHGERNVVWFEFERDKKPFVVVPAVGHLFSLKQKEKGWTYPRFDVHWIPSFEARKSSEFSRKYFENIVKLAKDADDFIVATDYDTEGAVIGFNIIRFICKRNNAKRMKFSTMTKEDLVKAFINASKTLDKNLIESGLTRHYLDWYWGINLTRALTLAIKNASQRFKILSTGRVQGPVLHMLVQHEKKIKAFKPKPFWQILLKVEIGKKIFDAEYEKDKIWDKAKAESVMKKAKKKKAVVKKIEKRVQTQKPPKPYNTTSFLSDVYRYFGYSPQQALNIAESLYQAGLISYPRTASEKLPASIGYKKILSKLAKQKNYEKDVKSLLEKKDLKPTEGKRNDPAHPAIFPTGEKPKRLGNKQKAVYDLVVRRFLAVFGDPAKRESIKVVLDSGGEKFFLKGKKTIEPGWTALYGRYSKRDEIILPDIKKGDELNIKKIEQLEKETQPPQRFSQGSVLKEMEKRGLGTKATRAQILQTLYNRNYLIGKSITVTDLGISVSDILEKNVPEVISEKLTRYFEKETEKIELGKEKREKVLEEARKTLTKILKKFKEKEAKIGKELTKSVIETQEKQAILGKCPKCGGILKVHKSWRTKKRFVGCSNYPKCKYGQPLPKEGIIEATGKVCPECGSPIIQIRRVGKRPFRMCIDINCPTKKDWRDDKLLAKVQAKSKAESKKAKKLEKNKEK